MANVSSRPDRTGQPSSGGAEPPEESLSTAAIASNPGPVAVPSMRDPLPEACQPRAVYPFGMVRRDLQRLGVLLLFLAVAVYFLSQVESILPPFVIAFFLAAILDPAMRRAERFGRSRWVSICVLYAGTLAAVVVLAVVVLPIAVKQFTEFTQNFNQYYANVEHTANVFLAKNLTWLKRFGVTEHTLHDIVSQKSGPVKSAIEAVLGNVAGLVATLASRAIWFVIIPIAGAFFMHDFPVLRARTIALFPDHYHQRIYDVSDEVIDVFSAYLRGLAKICAIYAGCAFVLFSLLGIRYALFLGMLAGVFYAVPYVGQLVTASVSGAVAYSMADHNCLFVFAVPTNSIPYTVGVILSVIVVNNVFDQLVYPRVVGGSVGLHPVVSIFALACGATLFGIAGMLLAVPVAAALQIIVLSAFPKLREPPPANLLGSRILRS